MRLSAISRLSTFAAHALAAVVLLAGAAAAQGQVGSKPFDAFGGGFGQDAGQEVKVTAQFTAPVAGKPGELFVTAKIAPGWHIYSITQAPKGPTPSQIKVDPSDEYEVAGPFQASPEPERKPEPIFDNLVVETHHGTVTWRAAVRLAEGVDPQSLKIEGRLFAQPCDATRCLAPQDFPFVAALGTGVGQVSNLPAGKSPPAPAKGTGAGRTPVILPVLDRDQVVAVAGEFTQPAAGKPAELSVAAVIKPGYHIYSLTQAPGGPIRSEIKLDPSPQFKVVGEFRPEPPPDAKPEPIFGGLMVQSHHGVVIWRAPVELAAGVDPAKLEIQGRLHAQPCDEKGCLPPQDFSFTATVGPGLRLPVDLAAARPAAAVDLASLAVKLVLAFLGGVILNLMPCVLPVISLKLFSFLQQAGESRARVMALNLWYTLGLLAVFMVLAALTAAAGQAWGEQFTQTWFKVGLTALVFVMALSFLGVWEIPIPGFAGGSAASQLQQKEGPAGAFFKGAFATILATPCSGPLLGSLFGFLLGQPAYVVFLIFGFMGLGMASPYLVIGVNPHLVRFLPKPGQWMATFKELMGFLLLATVVFLFSTISARFFIPTLTFLVGLWFACWWIGRTPITATLEAKATAWLGGLGTAALLGAVAFTLLLYESKMPWQPFSPEALAKARAEGKTVMVDFTADWCLTCKTNLKFAIDTREVREAVAANGVVPMLADWTDESPVIKKALNDLGYNSIPVLAIWPADPGREPIVLADLLTKGQVIEAIEQAGPSRAKPPAGNVALGGRE